MKNNKRRKIRRVKVELKFINKFILFQLQNCQSKKKTEKKTFNRIFSINEYVTLEF